MKNFFIFKNDSKKEGSKMPDYQMTASLKEGEPMIQLGGCWINEKNGKKFFSCRLNDAFVDHTKNIARKGFHLHEDDDIVPANPFD